MAYPDRILTVGALSTGGDVFEYFKGGLLDSGSTTRNSEQWPQKPARTEGTPELPVTIPAMNFLTGRVLDFSLSFPCTRGDFYDYIDRFTITTDTTDQEVLNYSQNFFRTIFGGRLYAFAEPQGNSNWPVEAVIHWGKIKCVELALFGSVGNGANRADTSIVGTGTFTSRVPLMTQHDLNYLRFAFARFDSYGSCHPDRVDGPPLTYVSMNTSARSITFTLPSGILIGDCEYSLDGGGTWNNPFTSVVVSGSTVTWTVPAGAYSAQQVQARVRRNRGAYIEEGPAISNPSPIPA